MDELRVDIDPGSGFCFGVVRAIGRAEESLAGGERVFSLGDIVHNRLEVQRLEALGLGTVGHDDLEGLAGRTLLIRAHGEPPQTFRRAEELGLRIIDATCPVVAKLQREVVKAHAEMAAGGGTVVILGKKGHPEVVGLTGQVPDRCVVVEKIGDLDGVDFSRPVYFLSQTTQSLDLFHRMAEAIAARAADPSLVRVHDTICRQVANRESHLREFASGYDAVIFVCGRKSSNGRVLFEVCRGANARTYNIEDESELRPEWFGDVRSVGVCGATSTPAWLMERVARAVRELHKKK